MDIERLKQAKKEKKLSYDDLARLTGYSRSTITNIFCGYIELPRHETIQAIERALGLDNEKTPPDELSEGERQWLKLYNVLTTENKDLLVQMVASFNDMPADRQRFVLSAIRLAIGNQK